MTGLETEEWAWLTALAHAERLWLAAWTVGVVWHLRQRYGA